METLVNIVIIVIALYTIYAVIDLEIQIRKLK